MAGEGFGEHPFPGIELEQAFDGAVGEVDEGVAGPADFLDVERLHFVTGLQAGVEQVVGGGAVFGVVVARGEVHAGWTADLFPAFDQFFVDGVELVGIRIAGFESVPLHHRGFEQRIRHRLVDATPKVSPQNQ